MKLKHILSSSASIALIFNIYSCSNNGLHSLKGKGDNWGDPCGGDVEKEKDRQVEREWAEKKERETNNCTKETEYEKDHWGNIKKKTVTIKPCDKEDCPAKKHGF